MLLLPLTLLTTEVADADVEIGLVELFEALDDFRCLDEDDDDAEDELPGGSGKRLLDFIPLFRLPPMLPPAPPGCGCVEGGSSSFSGDDSPSLELVSWLMGLYGGIVLTLPPFFNLL